MEDSKSMLYPTKFFLFTGETMTTTCADTATCAQIKKTIWKKKGWNDQVKFSYVMDEYAFRLRNVEFWFSDEDTFSNIRVMNHITHVYIYVFLDIYRI